MKEVKLKWKKLRDSYRDALKRQSEMLAKEPGAPPKKTYPWKYMGPMQFLQPHMNVRKKVYQLSTRDTLTAAVVRFIFISTSLLDRVRRSGNPVEVKKHFLIICLHTINGSICAKSQLSGLRVWVFDEIR